MTTPVLQPTTPWRVLVPTIVRNQRVGNVLIPWQIVLAPKES